MNMSINNIIVTATEVVTEIAKWVLEIDNINSIKVLNQDLSFMKS